MLRDYKYFMDYRRRNFTQLSAVIRHDTAEAFKKKLKDDELSYANWLKLRIDEYLNNKEDIDHDHEGCKETSSN